MIKRPANEPYDRFNVFAWTLLAALTVGFWLSVAALAWWLVS
jgi:hypothetical protein